MIDIILYVIAAVGAGAAASALLELVQRDFRKRRKEETIEQRIRCLTGSLTDATELINQIEREIKSRQALVDKLKSDIGTYNRIADLKRPEVEAVAQLIRGELQKEGRRSFWRSVAVNFVFFALGAIVSAVLIMML